MSKPVPSYHIYVFDFRNFLYSVLDIIQILHKYFKKKMKTSKVLEISIQVSERKARRVRADLCSLI